MNRAVEPIIFYAVAVKTLRVRYLEDWLPGESAKEWLNKRSGSIKGVDKKSVLPDALVAGT